MRAVNNVTRFETIIPVILTIIKFTDTMFNNSWCYNCVKVCCKYVIIYGVT